MAQRKKNRTRRSRERERRGYSYWRESRGLSVGYIFIIPLLGIYQIGVFLDPRARNGADPLFRELFGRFGPWSMLVLNLLLLALFFFSLARTRGIVQRSPGIYWTMLAESVFWGSALLLGAYHLPAQILALPEFARDLVASAGAGVYEEVVFRLFLLGGLALFLRRALGATAGFSLAFATIVSALLFSYAHHAIGGEEWRTPLWREPLFQFRAVMGAALGVLYCVRGLGIAVYSHALYNVLLFVLRGS